MSSSRVSVLGAALVVLTLVVPAAHASAATTKAPLCQGKRATIVAVGARRHVVGTSRADVIVALGGGDVISGGKGNDTICAGAAKSIDGGDGNDHITYWGAPVVHGGNGNDVITGLRTPGGLWPSAGIPHIYGDAGDDTIKLGPGNAAAYGGPGNDTMVTGYDGTQLLEGGAGNDVLISRGAVATLNGGAGTDSFVVPSAALRRTALITAVGDLVNGQRVTAPVQLPALPPPAAPLVGPAAALHFGVDTGSRVTLLDTYGTRSDAPSFAAAPVFQLRAATGTSPITSWSLDFGDSTAPWSGPGAPPLQVAHRYYATGTHTATLTVTDRNGLTATATTLVDVAAPPAITEATMPAGHLVLAAGKSSLTVTETITAVPGTHGSVTGYDLDWGDGSAAVAGEFTGQSVALTHAYTAGNWTPKVTVLDDHGGQFDRSHQVVITDGADHPNVADQTASGPVAVATVGTAGTAVSRTGTLIDHETVSWGDGSSDVVPAGASKTHTYAGAGPYSASVTVTDSKGGTGSQSFVAQAVPQATPAAELALVSGSTGGPITVGTTGTGTDPANPFVRWMLFWDDNLEEQGVGAPPATITRPAGTGSLGGDLVVVTADGDVARASLGLIAGVTGLTGVQAVPEGVWAPGTVAPHPGVPGSTFDSGTVVAGPGAVLTGSVVDFGDGATVDQTLDGVTGSAFGTHSWSAAGTHPGSWWVSDSNGTRYREDIDWDVAGAPSLTVTPSDSHPKKGETVTLLVHAAPGAGAVPDFYDERVPNGTGQSAPSGDGLPHDLSFVANAGPGAVLPWSVAMQDNHGGYQLVTGSVTESS